MTRLESQELEHWKLRNASLEQSIKADVIKTKILEKKLELYTVATALVPAILEEIQARAKR